MITASRLRELVSYDPATGEFRWKVAKGRRIKVGAVSGCIREQGHRVICIDGRLYCAHHLAFFYMTNEWPEHVIKHINGDLDDNRWSNLHPARRSPAARRLPPASRAAPKVTWAANRNNKLGVRGVSRKDKLFQAAISVDGKQLHLGYFDTVDEARAAYCNVAEL